MDNIFLDFNKNFNKLVDVFSQNKDLEKNFNKISKCKCTGSYKQYYKIYKQNIINNIILNKLNKDIPKDIIQIINNYNNYSLKQINSTIVIQRAFKRSNIYKKFYDNIINDQLLLMGGLMIIESKIQL
jgi:hypothetical protein